MAEVCGVVLGLSVPLLASMAAVLAVPREWTDEAMRLMRDMRKRRDS